MDDARLFVLKSAAVRERACRFISNEAPADWRVKVEPPKRTGEQNAKFHALCGDIAASGLEWCGKPRSLAQWKVLLVSGHAMATKEGSEMVPGLEGEFVNLRESTAAMSKKRGASLIEYTLAFCAMHGVLVGFEEEAHA